MFALDSVSTPEVYPLAEFKVSDPDPEIIPPIALDVDVELIITPDKPVTAARLTAPVPAVIVRPDVLPKLNATIPEPPEPPNALVPPPAPPPPPPVLLLALPPALPPLPLFPPEPPLPAPVPPLP